MKQNKQKNAAAKKGFLAAFSFRLLFVCHRRFRVFDYPAACFSSPKITNRRFPRFIETRIITLSLTRRKNLITIKCRKSSKAFIMPL
jgi:hypothetical protein